MANLQGQVYEKVWVEVKHLTLSHYLVDQRNSNFLLNPTTLYIAISITAEFNNNSSTLQGMLGLNS